MPLTAGAPFLASQMVYESYLPQAISVVAAPIAGPKRSPDDTAHNLTAFGYTDTGTGQVRSRRSTSQPPRAGVADGSWCARWCALWQVVLRFVNDNNVSVAAELAFAPGQVLLQRPPLQTNADHDHEQPALPDGDQGAGRGLPFEGCVHALCVPTRRCVGGPSQPSSRGPEPDIAAHRHTGLCG